MPLPNGTNRSITIKPQREMIQIHLNVVCDGTNYALASLERVSQAVVRDNGNLEVGRDLARITDVFALSDFPGAVQTGLTNFINAIDNKAAP